MNNLNTQALNRVPFIQRKSAKSKGLLHPYFQILIKTWKPFRRHTPAKVFPTTGTRQRGGHLHEEPTKLQPNTNALTNVILLGWHVGYGNEAVI